ncbi:helix-hairpin-helix domain-containing protein [Anaerolineales bacterium HSG25]|nr:helix-hairpin-helix domain-containing protein [Anaerolineales bacterium HSG25]
MDIHKKVDVLSKSAAFDCEGPPKLTREQRNAQFMTNSVAHVIHPQRGKIPVMRTMQTSACERNCHYCPFQAGANYRRVSLKPEELASAFDQMSRKKLVDGLFLSSGIIGGGVKAMDKLLATTEIVRQKYQYQGYIHLKIMPSSEPAQIERAARLADRLSINLEGANENRLPTLAPKKDFIKELLPPLYWLHQNEHQLEPWVKRPSLSTQFVVGPAGEKDNELLTTVNRLYREAGLGRAYYSAFNPIRGTPFENIPATPKLRQHRLYQADWLLRFYGFNLNELPFQADGNLPLTTDPKLIWAKHHLTERPVELNRASRSELLRVPGIGPKTATAIINARRVGQLTDIEHLKQLKAQTNRAAPYILLNGQRPGYQLSLL